MRKNFHVARLLRFSIADSFIEDLEAVGHALQNIPAAIIFAPRVLHHMAHRRFLLALEVLRSTQLH